jgi:hypothetical protein
VQVAAAEAKQAADAQKMQQHAKKLEQQIAQHKRQQEQDEVRKEQAASPKARRYEGRPPFRAATARPRSDSPCKRKRARHNGGAALVQEAGEKEAPHCIVCLYEYTQAPTAAHPAGVVPRILVRRPPARALVHDAHTGRH